MLFIAAGVLLAVSAFLPYWQARLFAPQYRSGLTATMYLNKVTGDIDEIDGLNHYVGVKKLGSLAVWERRLGLPGLALLILLCLAPLPAWLKAAAVTSFPLIFMADMKYWMHAASTQLDPAAPLKLKPFVIPLIGMGKVGQFRSELGPEPGFWLAVAAALLLIEAWRRSSPSRPLPAPSKTAVLATGLVLAVAAAALGAPLQPLLDAAPPGSTLDLAGARYEGPAVLLKTMTLCNGVIDGGGTGTVLTVSAPGVMLEDLTLRGSGENLLSEDSALRVEAASVTARRLRVEDALFGAFVSNSPAFTLEDSTLAGKPLEIGRRGDLVRVWNSDRARLSRNKLVGGRDMVLWFSTGSVIEGNEASGGRYGLHFMHTNAAVIRGNSFRNNSVGLYVMYSKQLLIEDNLFARHRGPSGSGLGLKESDSVTVTGNYFRDNRQAIFIDQSPLVETNVNRYEGNRFAYNDAALALMPGTRGSVVTGNSFEDNLQQVAVRGGGQLSGNVWVGNYWSDYAGYGRGETGLVPYRAERLIERLADARPAVRFFLYTPAAQAVELAARAFPVFRPKPLMVDERPLLRRLADPVPASAPQLAGVWVPMGLLSASAAALALARRRRERTIISRRRLGQAEASVWAVNLSKAFGGRTLFSGLSFTAMPGECLVLWGSNGAGKSTLIRCLLGVETFSGLLRVAGFAPGAEARERVGYLAQEFAGYDWTVREAMEFVCEVRGSDTYEIEPLLALCGLAGEEAKPVPALSGGMKQKLALAQALVGDPEILVLDEPCSSLDLKSRRELIAILRKLKGTRTLLMTSHHVDEVEALADRVLWLGEDGAARSLNPGVFLSELAS